MLVLVCMSAYISRQQQLGSVLYAHLVKMYVVYVYVRNGENGGKLRSTA